MDQTVDSRPVKLLPIVDEYTRECLCLDVARSIKAADVFETLRHLFAMHGAPRFIRSDNGPELISKASDQWAYWNKEELDFSRSGKPTDNGLIEAFNGRLRAKCLNENWFLSLDDAKQKTGVWRRHDNRERAHSASGYLAPREYAVSTARLA